MMIRRTLAAAGLLFSLGAVAAPSTYKIDPNHTFPAFEADHFGGLSVWRGKFNKTSGSIQLDEAAQTGSVNIVVDIASIEFGVEALNKHALSAEMFDVQKFPTATYQGTLTGFKNGQPSKVTGQLTLHGVTKPVDLDILSFKCMPNPMTKVQTCGADALATFKRSDFGVDYGAGYGFKQEVTLRISVEATKQ